jgi:hypothetical protein
MPEALGNGRRIDRWHPPLADRDERSRGMKEDPLEEWMSLGRGGNGRWGGSVGEAFGTTGGRESLRRARRQDAEWAANEWLGWIEVES